MADSAINFEGNFHLVLCICVQESLCTETGEKVNKAIVCQEHIFKLYPNNYVSSTVILTLII